VRSCGRRRVGGRCHDSRHARDGGGGSGLNYTRRQQFRRLPGWAGGGRQRRGRVAGVLIASAGVALIGWLLFLAAVGLGICVRHWLALAGRSRMGASSEGVQRALAPLQAEGWRPRHSCRGTAGRRRLRWAIAPTGIAVAIETKRERTRGDTLTGAGPGGLAVTTPPTVGAQRRRRRHVPRPGPGLERVEYDVLVVSIDRLTHVLRFAAGCAQTRVQAADEGASRARLAGLYPR
jgi:hypothetical protein